MDSPEYSNSIDTTDEGFAAYQAAKAEAIAKFLGVDCRDFGFWSLGSEVLMLQIHQQIPYEEVTNIDEFADWLASDAGTVAMIEAFRQRIEAPLSTNRYKYELEQAVSWTKMPLNEVLQAAILEVINDG